MSIVVKPCTIGSTQWQAGIINLASYEIRARIGFDSNAEEDENRGYGGAWTFTVNDKPCAVWYRFGGVARAWGSREALELLFDAENVLWHG